MKNIFIKSFILTSVAMMGLSSCQKEYLNPSTASETQVVSDVDGLVALANNLPLRYAVGRQSPGYTIIAVGGLTSFLPPLGATICAHDAKNIMINRYSDVRIIR